MKTPKAHALATSGSSRRTFLKTAGLVAGTVAAGSFVPRVHAGENNTIKVALVGAGGRGTGAVANALSTAGPTKFWAIADVFEDRIQANLGQLSKQFPDKVDVPPERQFIGFDGYKKAIDALDPGDVVLLATPPAFRPMHVEYAVEKGVHVFMEKSFAVDAPGVRRILAVGQKAQEKNLKIAGGLMSRHYKPLEAAIEQLHNGLIGDLVTCWAYREHGPVGFRPRSDGISELAHQIRNYSCFTWLNGSFFLDWLIHNLDVCCWAKGAWPVSAQGQGGRQVHNEPDQMFDHYAIEYTFPDGTRLFAQGRHMSNCWGFFGDVIHGTKGSALLGEGTKDPEIFQGYNTTKANRIWRYPDRTEGYGNAYQNEHDLLFDAIRQDKPYNEAERCANAAMVGILGRMAAFSGQEITWDAAMKSDRVLATNLEQFASIDDPAPVLPDAEGKYPVAMPGFADVL